MVQCEDHFAATNTARATTCGADLRASWVLGSSSPTSAHIWPCKIYRLHRRPYLALCGATAVGGTNGYRPAPASSGPRWPRPWMTTTQKEAAIQGCSLSLYGGLGAMVVGMAFAAYEAYFNREELRGIDVSRRDESKGSPDAPALKRPSFASGYWGWCAWVALVLGAWIAEAALGQGLRKLERIYLFGEEEPVE